MAMSARKSVDSDPRISIVTPCYNVGPLIRETARCLENQSFQDFEWIIVDDGSKSSTVDILKRLQKQTDLQVTVVFNDKQGGNACRNLGFRRSKGAFVKFLDADDLLEELLLEDEYKCAARCPDHLVVSRTAKLIDGKTLLLQRDFTLNAQDALMQYLAKPVFMHGGCLIPRGAVEAVGGWDENLKAGQDLDFFRRLLLEMGSRVLQQQNSYFYYRQHNKTTRLSSNTHNQVDKYESQLMALDQFVEILIANEVFPVYRKIVASNYELWGKYASRYCPKYAPVFFSKAKLVSQEYSPPGGSFYRIMRKYFGAHFASRVVMSNYMQWLSKIMAGFRPTGKEVQISLSNRLAEVDRQKAQKNSGDTLHLGMNS